MFTRKHWKIHNFTVPIKKEVPRIDKNRGEITENISFILQFIDSGKFMARSLPNLVNNFELFKSRIKCKNQHDDTKCETCWIKYKYYGSFLKYTHFKDDLIEYKSLCCNKNYLQNFDKKSKEWFFHLYKFSDHDYLFLTKFILLLQKGVYPYEYKDNWEKFNETSLPEIEDFYRHLNWEDITDADYAHVCKDFEVKNLGEYYDLYIQSHTLLLADVSENFKYMSYNM